MVQSENEVEMRRIQQGRPSGHTLIEIILVLILMGIIAALAIPRLPQISKTRTAASRVASDIQYAKELAIRLQTMSGIYLIDSTSYRIFQDNDINKATIDPVTGGDFVVSLSKEFPGVTVSANFGSTLKFDALGTPLDEAGNPLSPPPPINVTLSASSGNITIRVEPNTGKVTVL